MRKKIIYLLTCCLSVHIFLYGCTINNSNLPIATILSAPGKTEQIDQKSTNTLENATVTSDNSAAPTETQTYLSECIPTIETQSLDAEGVLATINFESYDEYLLSLSNLGSNEKHQIGNSASLFVKTSSDYDTLAYINEDSSNLELISSSGELIFSEPILDQWSGVRAWFENNILLIEQEKITPQDPYTPNSLVIFDLETQSVLELNPAFPNIVNQTMMGPHWSESLTGVGNIVAFYDPSLSYSVYAADIYDETPIILWDITNQTEILRLHVSGYSWGSLPAWTRDGENFLTSIPLSFKTDRGNQYVNFLEEDKPYVGGKELFLIGVDGSLQRLTYFTTNAMANEAGWAFSPNDSRVAFWLNVNYIENPEKWILAILEIETGILKTICVSPGRTPNPISPIWSPNGKYLMLTQTDVYNENPNRVLLLDIQTGEVMEYLEDGKGVGWLESR